MFFLLIELSFYIKILNLGMLMPTPLPYGNT